LGYLESGVTMAEASATIKFYYDYRSPFTYLAFAPVLDLERSHRVQVSFIPYAVDIKGAYGGDVEQRPDRDWYKVRYLYADARRFANERSLTILGPRKIFDPRLALLSGIYADRHGRFREYSPKLFERFFKREIDLEKMSEICAVLAESGVGAGFAHFVESEGPRALDAALEEAERDGVFGVPSIVVGGEIFWGNDRIEWVVRRLDSMGLRRNQDHESARG
jgi:2-hydroxychromene-2-carboxylate isomerase